MTPPHLTKWSARKWGGGADSDTAPLPPPFRGGSVAGRSATGFQGGAEMGDRA